MDNGPRDVLKSDSRSTERREHGEFLARQVLPITVGGAVALTAWLGWLIVERNVTVDWLIVSLFVLPAALLGTLSQTRGFKIYGAVKGALLMGIVIGASLTLAEVIDETLESKLRIVADPSREFEGATGLSWPATAKVVTAEDSHGGWMNEGTLLLVFDADRETLESFVSQAAPWDAKSWLRGPVPDDIASRAQFGPTPNSDKAFRSEPEDVWYAARERCCSQRGSLPFHNGDLVVIDVNRGRVWFFAWDF